MSFVLACLLKFVNFFFRSSFSALGSKAKGEVLNHVYSKCKHQIQFDNFSS